jgi:hypothetical protein
MRTLWQVIAAVVVGVGLSVAIAGCGSPTAPSIENKMSGDKMSGDKMGDKMHDKMGDKMGDKMHDKMGDKK